jgi:hypothetical protein
VIPRPVICKPKEFRDGTNTRGIGRLIAGCAVEGACFKARNPPSHPQVKKLERSLLTVPETRVHDSNEACRQAWFQLKLEQTT